MVIGNNLKITLLVHGYIFLRWPEERVGGEAGRVAPHRLIKAMVWIFAFESLWSSKRHDVGVGWA